MVKQHLNSALANIDNAIEGIKDQEKSAFNTILLKDLSVITRKIDTVSNLVS